MIWKKCYYQNRDQLTQIREGYKISQVAWKSKESKAAPDDMNKCDHKNPISFN